MKDSYIPGQLGTWYEVQVENNVQVEVGYKFCTISHDGSLGSM